MSKSGSGFDPENYSAEQESVAPLGALLETPSADGETGDWDFQLSSSRSYVPRTLLRNEAIENRLDSLAAVQPVTWVRAPQSVGKRTAVAAWLNHSSVDREAIWIRLLPEIITHRDTVASIFGAVSRVSNDYRHTNSTMDNSQTRAQQRLAAVETTRKKNRQTVVVVDLGTRDVTHDESDELVEFIMGSFQLRIVFIRDEDQYSSVISGRGPADITAQDLQLGASTIEQEGSAHRLRITEPILERLVGQYGGSPVIAAAFIEECLAHPRRSLDECLASAHARVAMTTAQQLMSDTGITILVLLTLFPNFCETFLVGLAPKKYIDTQLRIMHDRGLLHKRTTPAGESMYRAPESVREALRSLTLPYYRAKKASLHALICDYLVLSGDLKSAIEQQIRLDDPRAAVQLFCAHWVRYLRARGIQKTQELWAAIPAADVMSSLEASSALWVTYSVVPTHPVAQSFATRVIRAQRSELELLGPRGRLSVRTARLLILLEMGRYTSAESLVHDESSTVQEWVEDESLRGGGLHVTFLLASARVALHTGRLRLSAALYEESLAMSETLNSPSAKYTALCGNALTLVFNGEYALAQHAIDRASALEEECGMTETNIAAELLLSQGLVWANTNANDSMEAQLRHAEGSLQPNSVRGDVIDFLRAGALIRCGDIDAAASILRRFLGSISVRPTPPLFRQIIAWHLAMLLTLSNQPGAGLEVVKNESDNASHYPCFAVVRAFAQIAQGDPLSALETVAHCLLCVDDHAEQSLIGVYVVRAIAFEVMHLKTSAEDSLVIAVGLAANIEMNINLYEMASRELGSVIERVRRRMPDLGLHVFDSGKENDGQHAGELRGFAKLTGKEREILSQLVGGQTLAQIATERFVTENTIKTHTKNLYRKLGVSSRREAADFVANWQAVPPRD